MQITLEGGAPGGHNPPGRALPPWRAMVGGGPHQGPLTYSFSPLLLLPLEKIHHSFLSRVLAPEPEIFDLFAWSSISEKVLDGLFDLAEVLCAVDDEVDV